VTTPAEERYPVPAGGIGGAGHETFIYFTAPFSCLDGLPQQGNSHLLTEEAANVRGETTHNERRIPGRGPLGPLGPVLTAVCALLTGCARLAAARPAPASPPSSSPGPPSGRPGKYPGGIPLSSSTNTFLSIRPWYIGDPQWSKVQAYLNGGSAPVFNYHRFWAEVDIATAFESFAQLFPTAQPPSGF
jgi:hypothetical protein